MARDPFAEIEASGAVGAPVSTPTSTLVMRLLCAACVLALLALAFAYYLPLRKAHLLLTEKQRVLASEAGSTTDQLKKTSAQLLAAQTERDALSAGAKKSEEAKTQGAGQVNKLTTDLSSTLSKQIKAKQLAVETRGESSVITIDDKQLFGARDTSPTRPGKKLLCEVAKALQAASVRHQVNVGGHTRSSKVDDVFLRRDFPSPWQLSAARASGTAAALDECGLSGDHLSASGFANHKPEESSPKTSQGEVRLVLTPL